MIGQAKVWTDGATEGPNGSCHNVGLGVYMETIDGKKCFKRYCEGYSNNEAEFLALIWGVDICLGLGYRIVEFKSDSRFIVARANGHKPKIKHARMDMFQKSLLKKIKGFDHVSFRWIPRERNKKADLLSKIAIHGYDVTSS